MVRVTIVEALLALLIAFTGIERPVDADLTAIARQRVVEIQSSFSHDGIRAGTAEVLGWNRGSDDPVRTVAVAWRESPTHWAILSDRYWYRIGCAHDRTSDDRHWFACVLAPAVTGPIAPPPSSPNPSPTRTGPSDALPDTAVTR